MQFQINLKENPPHFYRLRGEMLGGTLIDKHGFIHLVNGE
jgi:hypothetical protein